MNASDQIRAYVTEHFILPARKSGLETVVVRAGEVHKALKWDLKRVPQVCSALSTQKFQHTANVELVEKKGPPSGQSTTVEFTFRLHPETGGRSDHPSAPGAKPVADGSGLEALFGIFEEEFRALGGGEAFLDAERASWGPDPWETAALQNQAKAERKK